MPDVSAETTDTWRVRVFKNRGLLLVPVALVLIIFGRPTVASAVAGIAIALFGELIRIWAVGYSGVTTRADVVTAPALVTAGPYSYVRNPLYVGNAITAIGFWLAFSGGLTALASVSMLSFVVALVSFVYATIIPLEEAYLKQTFGPPYAQYVRRVPSIFPWRPRLPATERHGEWKVSVIARAEIITITYLGLMIAAVLIKLFNA